MNEVVSIPVIADCDAGFGNVNNVIYAVKKFEQAGIAGICIEDKKFPVEYLSPRYGDASMVKMLREFFDAKLK